jgi:hypothetical protein
MFQNLLQVRDNYAEKTPGARTTSVSRQLSLAEVRTTCLKPTLQSDTWRLQDMYDVLGGVLLIGRWKTLVLISRISRG